MVYSNSSGAPCWQIGEQDQQYTLQFDEKSGPDPLGDMLMKVCSIVPCVTYYFTSSNTANGMLVQGMMSQASPEVQKKMSEDT